MLVLLQKLRCRQQRVAIAINGDIVTDSESDDPDRYIGLEPKTKLGKMIVVKKVSY